MDRACAVQLPGNREARPKRCQALQRNRAQIDRRCRDIRDWWIYHPPWSEFIQTQTIFVSEANLNFYKYMDAEVQFTINMLLHISNNKCRTQTHNDFSHFVIFINIHMNLRTDTGYMEQLQARSKQQHTFNRIFSNGSLCFFLPSWVHRTYVSLISLVIFWIFVLVDMSTYLSPILTIIPPRIAESVCRETIVRN